MKDRIRQVMEAQHMNQQVFAEFIGIASATLSGIFTGRTRPTINVVEAIKKKLPSVSTDWLMFGHGSMYADDDPAEGAAQGGQTGVPPSVQEVAINFDAPPSPTPQTVLRHPQRVEDSRQMRPQAGYDVMKNFDKQPRRVTEIRVFYDDQTWESFVPAKK